ncbi:MAG: hypothetical protein R2741_03350 [Methanolobus sp.]
MTCWNFPWKKAVELTESRAGYIGFVNEEENCKHFGWSEKSQDTCKIEKINTVYHFDAMGLGRTNQAA